MAAASARAFIISRLTDLSPASVTPSLTRRIRHQLPTLSKRRSDASSSASVSCCLSGGVSDEFVSTRNSSFDRGFSVIANMLKRIEPLDNSVISKGVTDSAKDSMKQTISTMLGLLPADQFSVTIRVSKHPLYRLLFSSVITGYTLWNAEYRISLMKNFDISSNSSKNMDLLEGDKLLALKGDSKALDVRDDMSLGDMKRIQVFGDLSPDAISYIQQLQMELETVKKELDFQKQENKRIEFGRESRNDLLDYLRSLDPDMVNELSRPSSPEVEEIMQQLVQNVVRRFFKSETTSDLKLEFPVGESGSCRDDSEDEAGTSRDYLAKLLFWCMLLGHHMRGLENRLHLSCAVGLL